MCRETLPKAAKSQLCKPTTDTMTNGGKLEVFYLKSRKKQGWFFLPCLLKTVLKVQWSNQAKERNKKEGYKKGRSMKMI